MTYAREIGGGGERNYVLMARGPPGDPGLTVFATHRLLTGLDSPKQEALRDTVLELFDVTELESTDQLVPGADDGPAAFGYIDAHHKAPRKLTLKDTAVLDEALAGKS